MFTEIGLRQAYYKMEVEGSSKEYLTMNTQQGLYCTTTTLPRLASGITI